MLVDVRHLLGGHRPVPDSCRRFIKYGEVRGIAALDVVNVGELYIASQVSKYAEVYLQEGVLGDDAEALVNQRRGLSVSVHQGRDAKAYAK